jgi:hypothetical protein
MRGAALVVLAGLSTCSVWMPGRSFEGPPPPLSPAQTATAERLRTHVRTLATDIGERNRAHADSLQRARAYIAAELTAAGYRVQEQPYEFDGETFHNVEARRAEDTGAFIVIGAHYDSVGGSPGANDNASGVAVLIELARQLRTQSLPMPVRFVAFANEEPPYFNGGDGMGSVAYVAQLADPATQIAWMLSLETVGLYSDAPGSQRYPTGVGWLFPDRGNFIAFVANPASRSLLHRVIGAFRQVATLPSEGAALPASIPGIAWSDQRSFWNAGIPAVMVTDTAPFRDAAYHHDFDTPERLDYANMARLVDGLAHAVPAAAAE